MPKPEDTTPIYPPVSPWVKGAAFVLGVAVPLFLSGVAAHFSIIYSSLQRADDVLRGDIDKLEERYFELSERAGGCLTEEESKDLRRRLERLEGKVGS